MAGMNVRRLSASAHKWQRTWQPVLGDEQMTRIIARATQVASERGGRVITKEDMTEAEDILAGQALAHYSATL